MTEPIQMHPDFAHLRVRPGEMTLDQAADPNQFGLLNVLAFGGAADKGAHMPALIGRVDDVVVWESTGASDALPFWNTNYAGDVYLLLMEGEVRVEFKTPETDDHLATYIARTGDLMTLPRAIAHRTFSTSGKRRISLEIVKRNPLWERIGEHAQVSPISEDRLGGFGFAVEDDAVVVRSPEDEVRTPRDFFVKGLRVLVAYELHLEHNEFEGGFTVHDRGSTAELKTRAYSEAFSPDAVVGLFKGLLERHGSYT
jgi:hypothetical protein